MPALFAFTDGACSGNPGPGGWGVLLLAREGEAVVRELELSGGEPMTTNNRMELMAAISALEALERPSTLTVVTDSAYVKGGITEWLATQQDSRCGGDEVANQWGHHASGRVGQDRTAPSRARRIAAHVAVPSNNAKAPASAASRRRLAKVRE